MKYFCVTTLTPYCGEETYHYLAAKSEDDKEFRDLCCELTEDAAAEWWDEECEDEWDSYEDYLGECSYMTEEISIEEYEKYKEY